MKHLFYLAKRKIDRREKPNASKRDFTLKLLQRMLGEPQQPADMISCFERLL